MFIPVSNRAGVRLEGREAGGSRGDQYIGGQRPEFHVNRKRREKGKGKIMGRSICDLAVFLTLHPMIARWARMTLYDFYFVLLS